MQPLPGSSLLDVGERRSAVERRGPQASASSSSFAKTVPRPGSAVLTAAPQKMQVPAGVEEDFESYNWLSDAAIAFASSCLATSGGSISLPAKRRAFPKSVMFVDPAMVFWLIMQEESKYIDEAKTEMKLHELDLLLCPINDAQSGSHADAGSHWSLLVCWGSGSSRRSKGRSDSLGPLVNFKYYDSLGGRFAEKGLAQAEELASRLAGKSARVEVGECAQQHNFYDCGVYVLLFSEIIAKAYVESHSRVSAGHVISPLEWEELLLMVTPEEIDLCRAHYHDIAREGTQH